MSPIVDGLEGQFDGQVVVHRINADVGDGPEIMRVFRIPGHPTTLLIGQDGQEITRFVGPQPGEILADSIQQMLTSSQE